LQIESLIVNYTMGRKQIICVFFTLRMEHPVSSIYLHLFTLQHPPFLHVRSDVSC